MKCRVCYNENNNEKVLVDSVLFGGDQTFDYFRCGNCGGFQLADTEYDISAIYEEQYPAHEAVYYSNPLKRWLKKQAWSYWAKSNNPVGFLVHLQKKHQAYVELLAKLGVRRDSSIVDIGCGSGVHLRALQDYGFSDLTGFDPYYKNKSINGINIHQKHLEEVMGSYEVVMSHHTIEHAEDQLEFIMQLSRLAVENGIIIISMPLADCWEMKHYGGKCSLICPPNHIFIHSRKSFAILCEKAGLTIEREIRPFPTIFSILSSEQYKRAKIPLWDRERSHAYVGVDRTMFSKREIVEMQKKAREITRNGQHGSGYFLLKKQ
jgi:SAM-dependent methyltransferase